MLTFSKKAISGPVLAALVVCEAFFAASAGHAEGLKYSVSLMAGGSQSPFTKTKTDGFVAPDFSIEGDSFSVGLSGISYRFLESDTMSLAARLAPRFVVADPAEVDGLKHLKRDTAIEAGLAAAVSFDSFSAQLEVLHDVSNKHDGTAVSAMFNMGLPIGERATIGLRAGATWMDQKLATYSYGVYGSEARPGLAAYSVKASVIPSVGIDASFALTDHTTLIGGVQAEFLPSSIKASPIVKRDKLVSAMIGVRYEF